MKPIKASVQYGQSQSSYPACCELRVAGGDRGATIKIYAVPESRGRDVPTIIFLDNQQATQLIANLAESILKSYPEKSAISK